MPSLERAWFASCPMLMLTCGLAVHLAAWTPPLPARLPPLRPQGPALELQQALPGVAELDLSDNLISSWAFVAELAAALPGLHTLNLSGNRLALPSLPAGEAAAAAAAADASAAAAAAAAATAAGSASSAPEHGQQQPCSAGSSRSGGSQQPVPAAPAAPPASLAGIQTLVLNGCGVTWLQAVAVAQHLPSLRELHLCNNGLSSLQLCGTRSSTGGGGSGGSSEEARAALAGLSLSSPSSSSQGSSSISRSSQLLAAAFPQLEVLDLEGNALSSWADVAALSTLPRLRSLLLSGNRLAGVQYEGGGCLASLGFWRRRGVFLQPAAAVWRVK